MARQTNGTNQYLKSASTLDLSAYSKVTVSAWFWVDAFANDDRKSLEFGDPSYDSSSGGFLIVPNYATGEIITGHSVGGLYNLGTFPRPSAGAWHHYVVNLDTAAPAAAEIVSAYIDAVSKTLTAVAGDNTSGTYSAAKTLYLMARGGTTDWLAGRIAEVAIYGGITLSQTDIDSLYNSGGGNLATNVQSGSLKYYWRILGNSSPEPNTVGGIDLTVSGATLVAHPFADTTPTSVSAVAPSLYKLRGYRVF